MPKYNVAWSKTYYVGGMVEVEADNEDAAFNYVDDHIGDYTGSMDYRPEDNYIDVMEVTQ